MSIVVIEPYYGGSHKAFLDFIEKEMPCDFYLYTLPARKWKWRMRLSAPYFTDKLKTAQFKQPISCFLCSTFLDVATFKALLPPPLKDVPIYTYFHENQFAYPVQNNDERDFHFALTNLTTIMASDKVAFNSSYNLHTLLAGSKKILKKIYDMNLEDHEEQIKAKSTILHPALEFKDIDDQKPKVKQKNDIPVIVWNHRWEHDKNPDLFFNTLFELDKLGVDFKLNVLGESFQRVPPIFEKAEKILKNKILHIGYLESRKKYLRCLHDSDIVVSTADHEFYGISVIEAVRAGCRPLLPNNLSYPELFPGKYLYEEGQFKEELLKLLADHDFSSKLGIELTEKFAWDNLKSSYEKWLLGGD